MSQKMKLFVFFSIISFLKYGYIVSTAFVKIFIFISIYRVYFKSHHAEVFSCKFASLTDIINITVSTALACKNQYFFHTAVCDNLHFFFNLLHRELHTVNMVIAVKTAIHTVILAVISNVKRRKKVNCITKMLTCFKPCSLCHLL